MLAASEPDGNPFTRVPIEITVSVGRARPLVRDLLGQSTGLIPHAYDNLIEDGLSMERITDQFSKLSYICEPGDCYSYQNSVFSLIEPVIETTTSRQYDVLMYEKKISNLQDLLALLQTIFEQGLADVRLQLVIPQGYGAPVAAHHAAHPVAAEKADRCPSTQRAAWLQPRGRLAEQGAGQFTGHAPVLLMHDRFAGKSAVDDAAPHVAAHEVSAENMIRAGSGQRRGCVGRGRIDAGNEVGEDRHEHEERQLARVEIVGRVGGRHRA